MTPQRIQRKRERRYCMPEGAIYVGRPTKWGNPWKVDRDYGVADVVRQFKRYLDARRHPWVGWTDLIDYPSDEAIRDELAGKDLACWCPVGMPCHASVLLEIANGGAS